MTDAVTWSRRHLPTESGRTAVVTGANAGIGLETTSGLAALGARVGSFDSITAEGAAYQIVAD